MPFLPGTPRKATLSQASSRLTSTQPRPPSPGNIRPIKTERKPENEKKEISQETEKATEEKTGIGKTASSSATIANEEGLPSKPEILPGETGFVRFHSLLIDHVSLSPFHHISFGCHFGSLKSRTVIMTQL